MPRRAARNLTDRLLAALKPPAAGRRVLTDAAAPGLTMRVTAKGERTWAVRYSPKGTGQQWATLGSYPGMKLAEARTEALAIASAAKKGIDMPAEQARTRDEARRAEGRPATVSDLLRRYVADYCKANQRRWPLTERMFDSHVIPEIGDKALTELRRADVVELLDELRNGKKLAAQVNRVRSQIIAALNWAVEREFLPGNPAAAIKRVKGIEQPRARILTDGELRAIWNAADGVGYPGGAFVKLLILTGQRRDEVRCLPWTELRENGAVWLLPGARNKSKRDHLLPLPQAARDVLEGATRTGAFVFSANGKKPYAGQKRLKEILDRESGVHGWTLHDIRRTVRTRLGEMGIARDVAQRVLNHAKPGLDRVYDHGDYRDPMAKALEAWAQRVMRVVAADSNVVALARHA